MDLRFAIVFLLVLGVACGCEARNLASFGNSFGVLLMILFVVYDWRKPRVRLLVFSGKHARVAGVFKEECISLVDSYVPLFFSKISSIEPSSICQSAHICEQVTIISSLFQDHNCEFCHQTISKILDKLKDPDTQIEILQTLLNMCDSINYRVKECKKLVFEYGPLILANSEKILEQTDIGKAIHACPAKPLGDNAVSSVGTVPSLADA
ncbi:proactivator polypeptide-like 1 [Cucumis sativus]|uniref:proactivator polypeptide-like 1 n=1 Tax=Cucumis sativus TaxID=3659 RepID=UPI0012F528E1|nr:proactivator polypeptide-like 1 [Cucumis sativus]